ncbi:hypothetical protein B566_EDAN012604 [Ephemera danica]|nr:hypothetical protein B566_EDAN012604 [Ephemera danica]
MPGLQRVVKPTTRRGKMALLDREPKVIENVKQTLFINGRKVSDDMRNCLLNLRKLKKPHALAMSKKHDILPFEDVSPIEQLCRKQDASLFCFASTNKKRPNNLIVGRLFDGNLLDMIEFGVAKFKAMDLFKLTTTPISVNTKPCMLFVGPLWETGDLSRVKSLFIDLFRGEVVETVRLQGLEHVIMFTATKDHILVRNYRITLKKSSTKLPRVELEDMGPSLDLVLRRSRLASADLMKTACRVPQEVRSKPKKNIATNTLGTTHGRIHLGKQKVGTIQTRKVRALRKTISERKQERKRKAQSQGAAPSKKPKEQ